MKSGSGHSTSEEDTAEAVAARRKVTAAGHRLDIDAIRLYVHHAHPSVRSSALRALERTVTLADADLANAMRDESHTVRRAAALLASRHPGVDLVGLLTDEDPLVVEAAAWACGERDPAADREIDALCRVAADHADPLCREAAVAALGAIGHPAGLPAILAATRDKPAVRRRAILALAPFDGEQVDEALARARDDRDWQVRQAAEDLS